MEYLRRLEHEFEECLDEETERLTLKIQDLKEILVKRDAELNDLKRPVERAIREKEDGDEERMTKMGAAVTRYRTENKELLTKCKRLELELTQLRSGDSTSGSDMPQINLARK